jgi:hypothetical protein
MPGETHAKSEDRSSATLVQSFVMGFSRDSTQNIRYQKSVIEELPPTVASLIGQEVEVGHEQISGDAKSYSS